MIGTINCKYETPCGWCTKWDKGCDNRLPERGQRAKAGILDDNSNVVTIAKVMDEICLNAENVI